MVYSIIVSAVFLLNTREVAFFVLVIIVHVAWLDEQLLDLLLDGGDLGLDLRALVLGDGRGDDRPGHAARATQSLQKGNSHINSFYFCQLLYNLELPIVR